MKRAGATRSERALREVSGRDVKRAGASYLRKFATTRSQFSRRSPARESGDFCILRHAASRLSRGGLPRATTGATLDAHSPHPRCPLCLDLLLRHVIELDHFARHSPVALLVRAGTFAYCGTLRPASHEAGYRGPPRALPSTRTHHTRDARCASTCFSATSSSSVRKSSPVRRWISSMLVT